MRWRLFVDRGLPGYTQMAIDESLYLCLNQGSRPALRFYTWQKPTLSLGYFQDYKTVVCKSFCVDNSIDVVRRITGGRAVLHQYELTYALTAPLEGSFATRTLEETYRLIAKALNLGLVALGYTHAAVLPDASSAAARREAKLPQCFVATSKYEISAGLRKIIGSAQKRSRDRFLQHGSILLDFDAALQNGCVQHPDPDIASKVAPLYHVLPQQPSFDALVGSFQKAFEQNFNMVAELSAPTAQEREMISTLERKYQSCTWTEGIWK